MKTMINVGVMVAAIAIGAGEARAERQGAASAAATQSPPSQTAPTATPLDLNTASESELISLPGIGPAKARALVEHRKKTPFSKVEDLLKVRGITPADVPPP